MGSTTMSSYLVMSSAYAYRRILRTLVFVLLLIVAASACRSGTIGHGAPSRPVSSVSAGNGAIVVDVPTVPCQEDEPCWDCRTMGNRVCSEVNPYGETELIYYPPSLTAESR